MSANASFFLRDLEFIFSGAWRLLKFCVKYCLKMIENDSDPDNEALDSESSDDAHDITDDSTTALPFDVNLPTTHR